MIRFVVEIADDSARMAPVKVLIRLLVGYEGADSFDLEDTTLLNPSHLGNQSTRDESSLSGLGNHTIAFE